MPKFYQEAEKYIKDIFYKDFFDTNQLNLTQTIYDAIRKEMTTDKDPDYYKHQDSVIHTSSLSSCLRGQAYKLLGAKSDKEIEDRKLGVFWVGSKFEDLLIDRIGDKIIGRQTEYRYPYKNLTLVGRSDFRIKDGQTERIGEIKTVHSDSFWYRQKEGNIIAWNNLLQLQTYLWLERILYQKEPHGIFLYVSKDDVTLSETAVKFNQDIIDQTIIPSLDILNEAYIAKNPNLCPIPEPIVYSESRKQWQTNWLAKYCDYHEQCVGKDWLLEAAKEVAKRNKELKNKYDKKATD